MKRALIAAVVFADEVTPFCLEKSAWMLILGLAAMDGAFEAVRKIESSRRYEFR